MNISSHLLWVPQLRFLAFFLSVTQYICLHWLIIYRAKGDLHRPRLLTSQQKYEWTTNYEFFLFTLRMANTLVYNWILLSTYRAMDDLWKENLRRLESYDAIFRHWFFYVYVWPQKRLSSYINFWSASNLSWFCSDL